jgi:3',5'-cyclic AMP phosphodiesterase CpdA
VRVGLISDVHFGPNAHHAGKLRKLSHRAEELTRAFVATMNDSAHPDLVVNLGDVIEDESAEADRARYGKFDHLLRQIDAEIIHVAGNHDSVNLRDDELAQLWQHEGELHFSREFMGWHLVMLRTLDRGNEGIWVPERQLQWLEDDLRSNDTPCLVFVHHPLSEMDLTGNRWFDGRPHLCRVANRREVRALLERSGNVRAVFNGHAHWTHCDVIAGIPYVTLQSLIENIDDDAPGRPARAHAVLDVSLHRIVVRVAGEQPVLLQFEHHPRQRAQTP